MRSGSLSPSRGRIIPWVRAAVAKQLIYYYESRKINVDDILHSVELSHVKKCSPYAEISMYSALRLLHELTLLYSVDAPLKAISHIEQNEFMSCPAVSSGGGLLRQVIRAGVDGVGTHFSHLRLRCKGGSDGKFCIVGEIPLNFPLDLLHLGALYVVAVVQRVCRIASGEVHVFEHVDLPKYSRKLVHIEHLRLGKVSFRPDQRFRMVVRPSILGCDCGSYTVPPLRCGERPQDFVSSVVAITRCMEGTLTCVRLANAAGCTVRWLQRQAARENREPRELLKEIETGSTGGVSSRFHARALIGDEKETIEAMVDRHVGYWANVAQFSRFVSLMKESRLADPPKSARLVESSSTTAGSD